MFPAYLQLHGHAKRTFTWKPNEAAATAVATKQAQLQHEGEQEVGEEEVEEEKKRSSSSNSSRLANKAKPP